MELQRAEKLITYKQAADALGLPYFKIQRAAAHGHLPTYSLLNGRKYVKLREIVEIIDGGRTPLKKD